MEIPLLKGILLRKSISVKEIFGEFRLASNGLLNVQRARTNLKWPDK